MFILTIVVANWISVYLVLECFDSAKVEQVLKEFKWASQLTQINIPFTPKTTAQIDHATPTVLC